MYICRDAGELQSCYQAISVIEYWGRLNSTGESQGHYISDIKNEIKNMWFRTNNNSDPIPITVADVSKYGYVVLFKKVVFK